MPESGLGAWPDQRPRDKLAEDSRLRSADDNKPLLVQILEKFVSGQAPAGPGGESRSEAGDKGSGLKNLPDVRAKGSASAAKQGGGIEFSDDKAQRSAGGSTSGPGASAGGFPPASMGIGEGILQSQTKQTPSSSAAKLGGAAEESSSSPDARQSSGGQKGPVQKHEKNLEKASSLLDEQNREEMTGFKAEIGAVRFNGAGVVQVDKQDTDDLNARDSNLLDKEKNKKSSPEFDESNYEEDFEEIDEDLPQEDDMDHGVDGIDASGGSNKYAAPKIGESHGITVSQSLGIDPSVDSLQLEEYDHIEDVENVQR